MRAVILLACLFCLTACAGETSGSLQGTEDFVHKQLDRRGL